MDTPKIMRLSCSFKQESEGMDEEELRELAYQLWTFTCNRRMERVKDELAEQGYDVDVGALNQWAAEGEWALNVRSKLEAVIPDLSARTWATMAMAEEASADYLLSVARGDFFPGRDWEEDINPALIKVRADAAKNILHMTGWSPTGLNIKERPKDPYNLKVDKPFHELSDEELFAIEAQAVGDEMERRLDATDKVRKKRRG